MIFLRASLPLWPAMAVLLSPQVSAVTNNLALTPPMGWNDWNAYGCGISETIVTNNAGVIAANGMKAAGYQFVDVDDGWASSRDSNGVIQAYSIAGKFPHGIPWLANYVHSMGLKLGVYTDDGTNTCSSCISGADPPKDPGSFNHEYVDAFTYATFGADYLKDDNCNAFGEDGQSVYGRMSDGLMKSGRPIVFCLCGGEDGNAKMYQSWSPATGNYWRTTGDIGSTFASMISHIDPNSTSAFVAGPGRWNDPDMLEIGNGEFASNLTAAQTHFTMWCEMAAPLIAGNNLTTMSAASLQILTNAEAIAVDQDPAGEQGVLVGGVKDSAEVWSKPLGYDFTTRAVALLNRNTNNSASITCNFTNLAFQPNTTATVRDLWGHTNLGTFTNSFTAVVPAYGAMLLKVVGTPVPSPAAGTNFLSDLQPVYAYTGWGTIVPNRSIGGNAITLGGTTYSEGISVNSRSGIEYNLGGVCSRFQATVGIDSEVGSNGSVIFEVFADGVQIYSSGPITGGAPPQTINLDMTGVRRLTLGVDDDNDGNSYDHGDWANALVIATNSPRAPYAPTGLVASPGNAVTLNWNSTLAAITYNVKRGTQTGGPYTNLASVPVTTFADTNVAGGESYFYVVSAVSSIGESSNSVEVSATPCNVPPPPTNVIKGSTSISNIVIQWNASTGATGYNVYRFTGNTPPVLAGANITGTNFTDTPVAAAATNYYYVTAINSCNQSGWSGFAGAVTPPAAPADLTASPGNALVTLNWTPPPGGAAFNVWRSITNGGPYALIASNDLSNGYSDLAVQNGATYYYVVSALDIGGEGPDSAQVEVTPVAPVTAYWTNTITGTPQNWNINANWTNTAAFPNTSGELAIISQDIFTPQTINLNQPITVGSVQIGAANGAASYIIAANGGSLTFNNSNPVSLTQLFSSRGDILATPVSLATNLVVINDSTNALTLAGSVSGSAGVSLTIGSGTVQVGDGTTNGSLGSLAVSDNAALIFYRTDTVAMSGMISGSGSIAQNGNGSGVLTLSGTNTFTGGTLIQNGTLQLNNNSALGPTNGGPVTITNGGTLDLGGPGYGNQGMVLGLKQIFVSGWGVNSNGAIINSSSTYQYANDNLVLVTMQGDTAIGGAGQAMPGNGNTGGRWDFRGTTSEPVVLSTGGHPYNLFKMGGNQIVIVDAVVDTNLASIDVRQGYLEVQGTTALGDSTKNLTVETGATFGMFQAAVNPNKNFILNGNGRAYTVFCEGSSNAIAGPITLNSGGCVFGCASGKNLALLNSVAGGGSLIVSNASGTTTVFLSGANNTYTGSTTVTAGTLALTGASSISSSPLVAVGSGATLDASGRGDTTLTLAGGQTLTGNGAIKGNVVVGSGATLAPGGSLTTLAFATNLTLMGGSMTVIEINKSVSPTNDSAQVGGTLTYGGTLIVTNLGAAAFAPGDSFKIFSAANYSGAFTNVSPAIPGINLAWATNGLTNGMLSVVSSPTPPPQIGAAICTGNNIVLTGSNGVPNWLYIVLGTTNLAVPVSSWAPLATNQFDANGQFVVTNHLSTNGPQQYFLLRLW